MLFLLSRRRFILNFLIFTIHFDPSETEFSQCKSAPADRSETFFDSSVVPFFLVIGKLGERTGQLWRNNSRRVRTQEKNSGDAVRRLGTIIQSIFCAQSGASIRLTVWKWSGESRYPGAFPPVLENFCRAISPGPIDRPWVSKDESSQSKIFLKKAFVSERNNF